jgi:hypothetical protein
MAKTLTATDRSALIRLASSMEKGSPERKVILASLPRFAMEHASEEALKKYLKDHPNMTDKQKSKHTVSKGEGEGGADGDDVSKQDSLGIEPDTAPASASKSINEKLKGAKVAIIKGVLKALRAGAYTPAAAMGTATEKVGEMFAGPMTRDKMMLGMKVSAGAMGLVGAGVGAALAAGPMAATFAGVAAAVGVAKGGAAVMGGIGALKGISMGIGVGSAVGQLSYLGVGGLALLPEATVGAWAEKQLASISRYEKAEEALGGMQKSFGAASKAQKALGIPEGKGQKEHGRPVPDEIWELMGQSHSWDVDELKEYMDNAPDWVSDITQDQLDDMLHAGSEYNDYLSMIHGKQAAEKDKGFDKDMSEAIADSFSSISPKEIEILRATMNPDGSYDKAKMEKMVLDLALPELENGLEARNKKVEKGVGSQDKRLGKPKGKKKASLMAKTLTAADRKALIRLASSMEKGSPERKALLAGLKKTASDVYQVESALHAKGLHSGFLNGKLSISRDHSGKVDEKLARPKPDAYGGALDWLEGITGVRPEYQNQQYVWPQLSMPSDWWSKKEVEVLRDMKVRGAPVWTSTSSKISLKLGRDVFIWTLGDSGVTLEGPRYRFPSAKYGSSYPSNLQVRGAVAKGLQDIEAWARRHEDFGDPPDFRVLKFLQAVKHEDLSAFGWDGTKNRARVKKHLTPAMAADPQAYFAWFKDPSTQPGIRWNRSWGTPLAYIPGVKNSRMLSQLM